MDSLTSILSFKLDYIRSVAHLHSVTLSAPWFSPLNINYHYFVIVYSFVSAFIYSICTITTFIPTIDATYALLVRPTCAAQSTGLVSQSASTGW